MSPKYPDFGRYCPKKRRENARCPQIKQHRARPRTIVANRPVPRRAKMQLRGPDFLAFVDRLNQHVIDLLFRE